MEILLAVVIVVLSGICILTKVFCLHRRQQALTGLQDELRDYQAAQRALKSILHEENRARAREQGLARHETKLLKELGKLRNDIDQLRREDGGGAETGRRRPTVVER